jgi:hypothetical protein
MAMKDTLARPTLDHSETLLIEARAIARDLAAEVSDRESADSERFAQAAARLLRSVIGPLERAPRLYHASSSFARWVNSGKAA